MPKLLLVLLLVCALEAANAAPRPLLVLSVDGLDHRYLRDADRLGLRIPTLRRLMKEGQWADGVVGVVPTVTWPSHTTLITGTRPDQHGILGNRRPAAEGGDYYWTVNLLKSRTLWQAVKEQGGTAAAITWPVTVDAPIAFNLPEAFARRNGGAMDLHTIAAKATPGLVEKITAMYPSFPREWTSDRERALATMYLVQKEKPSLVLVHFVDLDSEAHETGPFGREANATLEYTDELIGQVLAVTPPDYTVAIVSDHGFERADQVVNLPALLKRDNVAGAVMAFGGVATTSDTAVAAALRRLAADPANGISREIPRDEWLRFAPTRAEAVAAFEPREHFLFGPGTTEVFTAPREKGNHGLWPTRPGYRSVFGLWRRGIKPERLGEMDMLNLCQRLAQAMGVPW